MAAPSAPKAGTTNARPKAKDGPGGKKEAKVVYPSEFGSHTSMANEELTGKIDAADVLGLIVLKGAPLVCNFVDDQRPFICLRDCEEGVAPRRKLELVRDSHARVNREFGCFIGA